MSDLSHTLQPTEAHQYPVDYLCEAFADGTLVATVPGRAYLLAPNLADAWIAEMNRRGALPCEVGARSYRYTML